MDSGDGEMKFYYISFFSLTLLGIIYVIGTAVLALFGAWLSKRTRNAKKAMVPLFVLLYIGPISEELWIARNFGHLCRKEAGLFINKIVEVDGFYDDTHGWRGDLLRDSGYTWMEGRDDSGGKIQYWRHELVGNEIQSFVIDHPTARYRYEKDSGIRESHKVWRQSSRVTDIHLQEVLGHYTRFSRQAPWFFIGLDDPGLCWRP